ncbi:hypothetical protein, partial [Mesorhizobium sp.]|uniref:hypothetical protein n=1 Tax=Mesorhizobium sp. TaxID=1871066 RepID=UPI00257F91B0
KRLRPCDMKFVHCNICGDQYDPVVGHLLLPDAMPALNAVHLLPRCISNQARCHSSRRRAFFRCMSGNLAIGQRIGF